MKYEAFISYRHREIDEVVAKHIQKIIERYRVPKKIAKEIGRTHVGKVFRDSDELQAASNLSEIIRTGIENSEWLIVICTKRYKDSVWCMEEIEHFIELNGREKVIVILVEGEPNESFPSILTEIEVDGEIKHIEPLAVDIRGDSEKAIIKNLNNEQFRFLSTILQVDYDDLKNRQRERRIRRIATAATLAFAILATITGLIIKNNIDLYNSNQKTLRGESYFLSEYADAAFAEGDRDTAIKLALTALPQDLNDPDRPFVPRAMRALTQAAGIYDYSAGYHAGFSRSIEETTWDSFVSFSEDGSTMLTESKYYVDEIHGQGNFEVIRVSDGESLFRRQGPLTNLFAYAERFTTNVGGPVLSKDGKKVYYLADDYSLTCVDIENGTELYSIKDNEYFNMRVDPSAAPKDPAIVVNVLQSGIINCYDLDGNLISSVDLGECSNANIGEIDPVSHRIPVVLTVGDENTSHDVLYVVDLKSGEYKEYNIKGYYDHPVFTGRDILTCRTSKDNDEFWHISLFDLKTGSEKILTDPHHDINDLAIIDNSKCCYYHENTIYELDCTGTGDILWENKLPNNITSLCTGDGLIAVGMENGSVAVFDEKTKKQLKTPEGNGESVRIAAVSKKAFATRDSSGQNISVYLNHGPEYHKDVINTSIADIGGGIVPEEIMFWPTKSDRFLLEIDRGLDRYLAEYDVDTLEKISESYLYDILDETEVFEYIEQKGHDIFTITSYNYTFNYDSSMNLISTANKIGADVLYREDGEVMYECTLNMNDDGTSVNPSGNIFRMIDVKTGNILEERELPEGYYFAARLGSKLILQSVEGSLVMEDDAGKTTEIYSEDAGMWYINEKRGLVFFGKDNDKWCAYDTGKDRIVWEAPKGDDNIISFFGNNRYVIKDNQEVYDMDTWEKIFTVKPENGIPQSVYTTDNSPYIVDVCYLNDKVLGYLYEKDGDGEIIGVINGFIAMADDGDAIVYDDDEHLYKIPILSSEKIKQTAEQIVGDTELTPEQKEKYHIFR